MPRKYSDVDAADALVIRGGREYDRWIIGEAADSDTEYVVHLSEPRFIAKYWDGDENDAPLGQGGLSVEIDGTLFFDILWIDPPALSDDDVRALFRAANDAITRYSYKEE